MRVDGNRIRKEKVADSKMSGYVWMGPEYLESARGVIRALPFSLSPGLRLRSLYGQSSTKEASAEEREENSSREIT